MPTITNRDAFLLTDWRVYAAGDQMAYVGDIDEIGKAAIANLDPQEIPHWGKNGWRVRLDRPFEDMIPLGRTRGLQLAIGDEWSITLASTL